MNISNNVFLRSIPVFHLEVGTIGFELDPVDIVLKLFTIFLYIMLFKAYNIPLYNAFDSLQYSQVLLDPIFVQYIVFLMMTSVITP